MAAPDRGSRRLDNDHLATALCRHVLLLVNWEIAALAALINGPSRTVLRPPGPLPWPDPLRSRQGGAVQERLGIAGSGTIACGLAATAARHGTDVLLWARSDQSAERATTSVS